MAIIVEMPRLSDTMTEGTLAEWRKSVGQQVEAGEALAEIETDKAVMTFESFDEGVVLALLLEAGDTVPLGTPMAVLGEAGEDITALLAELRAKVAAALAGESAPAAPAAEAPQAAAAAPAPEPVAATAATPEQAVPVPAGRDGGVRIKASPLARRIALQRGIDLAVVAGSGPYGRVVKQDLEGLDATRRADSLAVRGRSGAAASSAAVATAPVADEIVRVTQMRKTIAGRLVDAKQTAPHFYVTITVDCDPLVALRKEINSQQEAVRVSYNDLVMRACVVALKAHPGVNAAWEGKTIRRFGSVNLGFAVAIDAGLITPVVRNAETKGLLDMAVEIRELAGRARESALQPDEYTGNSFCVSNLGMFGVEHFTAIINPPAACILAVGALRDEAVVRDGELAVGKVMSLTLSCDHRVVDGVMGAKFLQDLKRVLEAPLNLILT